MRGRDLPFPLVNDATGRTTNTYRVGKYPLYMLLDPQGLVVRGGSIELLEEILERIRKEGRRAGELLARLKAEKNPRRAAALVPAIAAEGGEGAARALIEFGAEIKDRAGQLAVLEGLGRIGWRGASAYLTGESGLGARDRGLRLAAAAALGSAGDASAVPALIDILGAQPPEADLVAAACAALVRLAPADPRVREAARELAGSRNATCRAHALEALVDLDCPEAPRHLTQALAQDASAPVRLKAAQLLARSKATDAVDLLRKTVEEDRSPAVRKAAEAALKEMEAGG